MLKKIKGLYQGTLLYYLIYQLKNYFKYQLKHPQKSISCKINEDNFTFSTEDALSKEWYIGKFANGNIHEAPVTYHMIQELKRCKSFADVGSYLGYFTVIASNVMKAGNIYSFELDPYLSKLIEKSVGLNKNTNSISVINAAVGSGNSIMYAVGTRAGLPVRFITPVKPKKKFYHFIKIFETKLVSLDSYIHQKLDLIKIDVEGAEYEVLKGMERILGNDKPKIYLEVHPNAITKFGVDISAVSDLLKNYGYSFFEFGKFRSNNTESEMLPINDFQNLKENTMVFCTTQN